MGLLKTNTFKVVGRLSNVNLTNGNRKDNGAGFISGKATVISNLGGRDNEFEISFYANQKTKEQKDSQLYISYSKMNELVGKKVEVTGEIRENRYFSVNANQMVSSQQLSGKFIRGVAETTADEGSYELGGFIVDTLKEKVSKKDNSIYLYELTLGQSNYSDTGMNRFVLHVNPSDTEIIHGAQNYQIGQTVSVNGDLRFIVNVVQSQKDNTGGFGEPVTRTFTNRQHNFYIIGGSPVITDVEKGMYPSDVIKSLVSAYKARDVELAGKAKENNPAPAVEESPKVTFKQTSLI